jgi:ElaB/YqjD/DUF883 family membrane-anchored ribosome-binding protein
MEDIPMANTMINNKRPGESGDRATIADVKDDIRALRNDVSDTVADIAQAGGDMARDAARSVGSYAEDACRTTGKLIAQRPIASVLIAVGVGAILARLVSRR